MLVVPKGSLQTTKHKAVFFDAGNTLFKVHPSVGELYAQVAREYDAVFDAQTIENIFHEEWRRRSGNGHFTFSGSARKERIWWHDLVKAVFDQLGGIQKFEEYFDQLYELFAGESVWRLFPEVSGVLEECNRRGVIFGIVSNWDSRLLQICDRLHLTPHLKFILASTIVGVSKPDPGIFRLALQHAGVTPQEAIHVGDSIEDDVYGARAAGIDALLIERNRNCELPGIAATDSLQAILEFC